MYIKNKSKIYQTIYVHQSLPFVDIKMSLLKETKMWIYQNIIGYMIKKSINKANKVIVQTKWMKEALLRQTKVEDNNIEVIPPTVKLPKGYIYSSNTKQKLFFFPASAESYKNHKIIMDASRLLIDQGFDNFKVEFTLTGKENKYIAKLKKCCSKRNIPIFFIGNLSYEEVMNKYTKSTLLFPSYIETFGLPLLEARTIGSPIIASNTPFSKEIGEGYNNIRYFDYTNAEELSNLMKDSILRDGIINF